MIFILCLVSVQNFEFHFIPSSIKITRHSLPGSFCLCSFVKRGHYERSAVKQRLDLKLPSVGDDQFLEQIICTVIRYKLVVFDGRRSYFTALHLRWVHGVTFPLTEKLKIISVYERRNQLTENGVP